MSLDTNTAFTASAQNEQKPRIQETKGFPRDQRTWSLVDYNNPKISITEILTSNSPGNPFDTEVIGTTLNIGESRYSIGVMDEKQITETLHKIAKDILQNVDILQNYTIGKMRYEPCPTEALLPR